MNHAIKRLASAIMLLMAACCGRTTGNAAAEVEINRNTDFTGRGNAKETLLEARISSDSAFHVKFLTVTVDAKDADVSCIMLIQDSLVLSSRKVVAGKKNYKLTCNVKAEKELALKICADIPDSAAEGDVVSADIEEIRMDGGSVIPQKPEKGGREILLARKALFMPGDYGSKYWRIPAIRQLRDGTLLVVNDRRNDSQEDLPNEIDVVSRYSTDGGRTWSEPVYIAKNGGRMYGFGDPGLAELEDGTVICTFCGGQRLDKSNWDDPQRSYFSVSKDHGRTWSEPVNITEHIWGPDPANPFCKRYNSSFFSSGNSLVLTHGEHKGRMLVANVTTYDSWRGICNHAVYTDDGGRTWNVSELAYADKGDEAKMVELLDGRILMSIRQTGNRAFVISEDGGETWSEPSFWPEICTNACNGDLIRYNDGILLHSIPNSMDRENVSIFLSFDEGKTWPEHKSICRGKSVYSSLTVLADGTIGAYLEENPTGACELWFENFSLEWLRNKE